MTDQEDISVALPAMRQARAVLGKMELAPVQDTLTDEGFECRVNTNIQDTLDALKALNIALKRLDPADSGLRVS